MSFEEEIENIVFNSWEYTVETQVKHIMLLKDKHCLDKAKVKEAIEKLQGCYDDGYIIKRKEGFVDTLYVDVEELLKELKL